MILGAFLLGALVGIILAIYWWESHPRPIDKQEIRDGERRKR